MMDSTIIAAIISGLGGIAAALASVSFSRELKSKSFRSRHEIPNILGTWQNEWFIGDKLYIKDTIEIEKWSKNNQFQGVGREEKGKYIISGEIGSRGEILATYKNEGYPTTGYIGTFILKLSIDGKSMEGYWHGLTPGEKLEGGKVVCKRI